MTPRDLIYGRSGTGREFEWGTEIKETLNASVDTC